MSMEIEVFHIYTGEKIKVHRSFLQRAFGNGKHSTHEEAMNYTSAVGNAKAKVETPAEVYTGFVRGMRVLINENSGFSKGARGAVVFVEPSGKRVWVHRDRASSPCFFMPHELTLDDSESPAHPVTLKNLISDNCRFLFSKFMVGKFEEGFETVVYRILDWASVQDLYKDNSHVQKAEGVVVETPGS